MNIDIDGKETTGHFEITLTLEEIRFAIKELQRALVYAKKQEKVENKKIVDLVYEIDIK